MFQLTHVIYKNILDLENLHIPSQQTTCIIGESGSGKTTLLRLLNKLISVDSGQIQYNGRSLHEMDAVDLRREVVMLGQTPAIYPGTVRDNLLMGLKFSEKPMADDNHLKRLLDRVDLNKALDETAHNLSGGEKQRLALGRVILMDPRVLLLDEPSAALDENTEQKIIEDLVTYVKSRDKTLIMVTHSKRMAQMYGDRIIEIKKGQAKAD